MKRLIIALALLMPVQALAESKVYSCESVPQLNTTAESVRYTVGVFEDRFEILNPHTFEWENPKELFSKQTKDSISGLLVNLKIKNHRVKISSRGKTKIDLGRAVPEGSQIRVTITYDLDAQKRTSLYEFYDPTGKELEIPRGLQPFTGTVDCSFLREE